MIPHSRPWIADADVQVVTAILRSEMVGQGATVERFEAGFSHWLGMNQQGIAVSSGSAALQLALMALGVSSGDEVILPTYVCRSVFDAVRAAGGTPVLADVGHQGLVTPSDVAPIIGLRTKAVIVPHLFGAFADVAAFRTFGVPIVEDCAQAVDRPEHWKIGGDIAVFSFHPTKCLTTGEGGMAVAVDPNLNARMRAIRDGRLASRVLLAPMSDLAAALGLTQLGRYDHALERRRAIARTYRRALGDEAPFHLRRTPWDRTMHFRFVVTAADGVEKAVEIFASRGVIVRRAVDTLLHRLEGRSDRMFPVATELFETLVSVPIYPALSDDEVERVSGALAAWSYRASGTHAAVTEIRAIQLAQGPLGSLPVTKEAGGGYQSTMM